MKKLMALSFVTLVGFSFQSFAGPNAKKIANGKFVYDDWGCKGCHGIGKLYNQDPNEGPNLEGLYKRRTAEWVKKFVKNPAAMIEAGDKDAVAMQKQYGKTMKTMKLSDEEWDDVLEYIKSASGK